MPSPFPGMDPYLEDAALWPTFHHQLVECLYQILLPGLVDRYRARVAQRRYLAEPTPDSAAAERQEDFVEIRQRNDGRLVTLLEVVSPANKTTAPGRAAYLDQRQAAKAAGANLVEIDLVLQGQPTLEYSRDGLPDWDYAVTVTRASKSERLRDLHGHAAEAAAALPPAAGRRRPRHRRRPLHHLHALLRPGRLRGQDRLQARPVYCSRERRPPLARQRSRPAKAADAASFGGGDCAGGLLPLGAGRQAARARSGTLAAGEGAVEPVVTDGCPFCPFPSFSNNRTTGPFAWTGWPSATPAGGQASRSETGLLAWRGPRLEIALECGVRRQAQSVEGSCSSSSMS